MSGQGAPQGGHGAGSWPSGALADEKSDEDTFTSSTCQSDTNNADDLFSATFNIPAAPAMPSETATADEHQQNEGKNPPSGLGVVVGSDAALDGAMNFSVEDETGDSIDFAAFPTAEQVEDFATFDAQEEDALFPTLDVAGAAPGSDPFDAEPNFDFGFKTDAPPPPGRFGHGGIGTASSSREAGTLQEDDSSFFPKVLDQDPFACLDGMDEHDQDDFFAPGTADLFRFDLEDEIRFPGLRTSKSPSGGVGGGVATSERGGMLQRQQQNGSMQEYFGGFAPSEASRAYLQQSNDRNTFSRKLLQSAGQSAGDHHPSFDPTAPTSSSPSSSTSMQGRSCKQQHELKFESSLDADLFDVDIISDSVTLSFETSGSKSNTPTTEQGPAINDPGDEKTKSVISSEIPVEEGHDLLEVTPFSFVHQTTSPSGSRSPASPNASQAAGEGEQKSSSASPLAVKQESVDQDGSIAAKKTTEVVTPLQTASIQKFTAQQDVEAASTAGTGATRSTATTSGPETEVADHVTSAGSSERHSSNEKKSVASPSGAGSTQSPSGGGLDGSAFSIFTVDSLDYFSGPELCDKLHDYDEEKWVFRQIQFEVVASPSNKSGSMMGLRFGFGKNKREQVDFGVDTESWTLCTSALVGGSSDRTASSSSSDPTSEREEAALNSDVVSPANYNVQAVVSGSERNTSSPGTTTKVIAHSKEKESSIEAELRPLRKGDVVMLLHGCPLWVEQDLPSVHSTMKVNNSDTVSGPGSPDATTRGAKRGTTQNRCADEILLLLNGAVVRWWVLQENDMKVDKDNSAESITITKPEVRDEGDRDDLGNRTGNDHARQLEEMTEQSAPSPLYGFISLLSGCAAVKTLSPCSMLTLRNVDADGVDEDGEDEQMYGESPLAMSAAFPRDNLEHFGLGSSDDVNPDTNLFGDLEMQHLPDGDAVNKTALLPGGRIGGMSSSTRGNKKNSRRASTGAHSEGTNGSNQTVRSPKRVFYERSNLGTVHFGDRTAIIGPDGHSLMEVGTHFWYEGVVDFVRNPKSAPPGSGTGPEIMISPTSTATSSTTPSAHADALDEQSLGVSAPSR
ncbi:unnamed protein product [Amoebophrya sp. A120]|nr:unnamed protein product [Amoebophrya sp. A120]|eukprot:GSA120T00022635001.1